jgi:hypothetical protein
MDPTRWALARSAAPASMKALIGLLTAAMLLIGSGCAKTDWIDRTLVTVDVTGTWAGSAGGSSGGGIPPDFLFELEQQGSTVKGIMRIPAGGTSQSGSRISPGPMTGTVAGDVFRVQTDEWQFGR